MLEGMFSVIREINGHIDRAQSRQKAGIWAAGLMVQRKSQRLVPVEKGPLRASAYTRPEGSGVVVGYSADYALAVHENVEAKLRGRPRPSGLGEYWGPHGEPKFLERPFRESKQEIINIVAGYTAIRR